MKKLKHVLLFLFFIIQFGGCFQFGNKSSSDVMTLDEGTQLICQDLLSQMDKVGIISIPTLEKSTAVIDPFKDTKMGQELTVNTILENLLAQCLSKRLMLLKMSPENLNSADFILNGIISSEFNPDAGSEKNYHLYVTLVNKDSGLIVASSDVWIQDFEYAPLEMYADSPVYLKDRQLRNLEKTAKSKKGDSADPEYLASLDTQSLLNKGDDLYANRQYDEALLYYNEAEGREDGRTMKTYSGLYNIHRQQRNPEKAEYYFGKLIEAIVEENQSINVKLFFEVNSTEFIRKPALREQYMIWLRQIGYYFQNHQKCVQILGHASHTGTVEYNKKLSAARAEAVQKIIESYYPNISSHSQVVGMGFDQNIIGTGADDISDAIDRRVEFKLMNCNNG